MNSGLSPAWFWRKITTRITAITSFWDILHGFVTNGKPRAVWATMALSITRRSLTQRMMPPQPTGARCGECRQMTNYMSLMLYVFGSGPWGTAWTATWQPATTMARRCSCRLPASTGMAGSVTLGRAASIGRVRSTAAPARTTLTACTSIRTECILTLTTGATVEACELCVFRRIRVLFFLMKQMWLVCIDVNQPLFCWEWLLAQPTKREPASKTHYHQWFCMKSFDSAELISPQNCHLI